MTFSSSVPATVPEPEPAVAAEVFGDRLPLVRAYAGELARRGEELGLIGPLELGRLWTRHLINCGLVSPLVQPGRLADIGSGAGLPGLVLALSRPDVDVVLVEPMDRRVAWLEAEATRLGLTNVTVIRGRAEDLRGRESFDQVTARAVAALGKLVPMTAPLVRPGGQLLLMKGARVEEEIVAARAALAKHRVSDVEVVVLGDGERTEFTRVFRATVDGAAGGAPQTA